MEQLQEIVAPLLSWFAGNARALPWRDDPTPYRVWVSEIMLQQTRVEAVKPYFARFMEALPDVAALAACPKDRLLKLWEGLGYYNRVRNMQTAARTVMEEYGGQLPADPAQLMQLKGIGSYTAGAIASLAFNVPCPAVDGNVLRVIARVTASEEDIAKASVKTKVEEQIRKILPEGHVSAFNQALMELGALVCVPNGPAKCETCPLGGLCRARALGKVQELPRKTMAKPRRVEKRTVLVIRDGERVAIRRRPEKGLLAGLYELPNEKGWLSEDQALHLLKDQGFAPLRIQKLPEAKHIFSHIEWHMIGYLISIEEPQKETIYLFAEHGDIQKRYAIPAAFAAYTASERTF